MTEQNALYTIFLPIPVRKEGNVPKLKNNYELTVLIYIMCYQVRLMDHDFVVAPRHKLIPSVYAVCNIDPDNGKMTYSGNFMF